MVNIVEVKTRKQMKAFVNFVTGLYKDDPNYVPYLYNDEINMLNPRRNLTLKDCDTGFYLAYKDGVAAGRVGAILQRVYNERTGKKSVRFTRFDCIDDIEVARALLDAVERFAEERGMDTVFGPYGFNETDRAAYLVSGFGIKANFGTNYNFPYYDTLLTECGYAKDADWIELKLLPKESAYQRFKKLSEWSLKRYNLHIAGQKNFKQFAKKYGWKMFECFNDAYNELPGFVPFTREICGQIIKQFSIALKMKYITAVIDSNDNVVGFAICMPSLADAVRGIRGRLLPFGFIRLLHTIHTRPKKLELCLIGVVKEYRNKGVNASLIFHILESMKRDNILETEAYPQFEYNAKTISQWEDFDMTVTKTRRVVAKTL